MTEHGQAQRYSDDYKHFDNLIWQLPVWSTAIFLLAVTGVAYIANANFDSLAAAIDKSVVASLVLYVCVAFQLAIFNALVRFRDHQRDVAVPDVRVFAKWWYSGQTWLQFAVIGQTCVLLYLALRLCGAPHGVRWSVGLGVALFGYSLLALSFRIRKRGDSER